MLTIVDYLSNNAIVGGISVTILVIIYKIYQILKHDKKEDNNAYFERSIRDELRRDIKELKETNKVLKKENEKNLCEIMKLRVIISDSSKVNFKNKTYWV